MLAFVRIIFLSAIFFTVGELFLIVPIAATIQGLQVGMEAPDFSVKDMSGGKKTFSELGGAKLTMVIFWSTWSANSEKALLSLEKLYQRYRERGLSVIAINVDGQEISEGAVRDIGVKAGKLKLSFPVLIDHGLVAFHDYGVIAVPTTVVLDKERVIRYELSGFPLVGSGEMTEFVSATLEGRKPAEKAAEKAGYKPDKKAVRFFNMGNNTLKSGRTAGSAEMWFKKTIEADPKFVTPYLSLGKFYSERNNASLAREQFEKALTIEPLNPVALCELALLFINGGKIDEGKALIKKAADAEEAYSPCYYYLGLAYGKEGNLDESFKSFDMSIQINPLDPNIYIYKGKVCEENRLPQEAARAYRKALEIILR